MHGKVSGEVSGEVIGGEVIGGEVSNEVSESTLLEGFTPRPDTPPDRTVRSILNSYFKMRNLRPLRPRPQR